MEIAMNSKFTGMSHQEMMNVDGGGGIAMAVIVIVGSMLRLEDWFHFPLSLNLLLQLE